MAKPAANLRLFAAIHPPSECVRSLLNDLNSLEQLPNHRVTPAEQVHLTVIFIGDTPAAQLNATIESVERAAAGLRRFPLTPQRLITLPERDPARLIAAELDGHPTLRELHQRLVTRLATNPRDRDAQRFRPHLTLCRFQSPAHRLKVDHAINAESFIVDRVSLMRSTLAPTGAVHHEVASFAFE